MLPDSLQNHDHEKGADHALAAFAGVVVLLALVQVLTISVSLAGLTLAGPLAVVVLVVALGAAGMVAWRYARSESAAGTRRPDPAPRSDRNALTMLGTLAAAAAVAWFVWVWGQLWLLAGARPPYDWDGLYYHLPAIHEWVANGRIAFIGNTPDIPFVNFPMGVELTSYFVHQLTGTSRFVNACNLWYWPLAFLSLVVIATRLGARGAWRWAAGALLFGAPVFVSQSVTCYIDPGFASAVMAAIAASCVFVFDRDRERARNALLLGAAVGLVLGSKGTGAPFAGVILVAVTAAALARGGFGGAGRVLASAALTLLVAFLVGGYWYARNAYHTGNPIHPIQIEFGQKVLIEGYDPALFLSANLPTWLAPYPAWARMFVAWFQPDAPVSGYAPVGGMGYIWLAAALPALFYLFVLAARRRYPGPAREFLFVSFLALILFAVQPASWWSRLTIWFLAIGLPCIAVAASHAASTWRATPLRSIVLGWAIGSIALAVWESNGTLQLERATGRTVADTRSQATYMSSLDYILPGMAAAPGFEEFFRARRIARSPWERIGTLLGGVLAMPLDAREITVLPLYPEEADVDALADAGVEWIIWDVLGSGEAPAVITSAADRHHVFHPAPDVNFHIFRLESTARARH